MRFDNTFLLLLHGLFLSFAFAFVSMCRISTSTVFSAGLQEQSVQEELTPFPSSPTAFRLLSHTLTPIFYTSVTAPPVLCGRAGEHKATVHIHMHAKAEISNFKAADSGFHFGPCAVRFIH